MKILKIQLKYKLIFQYFLFQLSFFCLIEDPIKIEEFFNTRLIIKNQKKKFFLIKIKKISLIYIMKIYSELSKKILNYFKKTLKILSSEVVK